MAAKKGKKETKPEVTLQQLIAVAEDFNSFMFADPEEGIPTDLEYDDLLAEVVETADELETTDTILAITGDTLDLLGIDYSATIADEEAPEEAAEEPKDDDSTEEDAPADNEDSEGEGDDGAALAADIALIKKTKDVEKMKSVAKAWGIRIPPPFYKDVNKLREYLIGKLDGSAPAPQKKAKADKTAKKEKKSGEGLKKVGVIAKIVEVITASGKKGISKETILAELKEAFPDRDEKSMMNTINVQVPNRMSKEKFPIGKTKDGLFFKQ